MRSVYTKTSSHVCDDDGFDLENSLLISDEEQERIDAESRAVLAKYRQTRKTVYNPTTRKMEVVKR